MNDSPKALYLAEQVLGDAERYPQAIVQCAAMLLLDRDSLEMQSLFLDVYGQASVTKNMLVGRCLPFPPEEDSYYEPGERAKQGVEIGREPVHDWVLRLFAEQLRRHCLVLGMTGSGKTNVLQLIALASGEIDK